MSKGRLVLKRCAPPGVVMLCAALAVLGLVIRAEPASANGGPHGGYTLTTSACAGCHRTHTAVAPNLLTGTSVYALCTTCHAGAVQTDVVHGVRTNDGATLNGGGFESVNGRATTSRHAVKGVPVSGTPASGNGTAWGSQNGDGVPVTDRGVGVQGQLECTSCHNPHGSTNYRILQDASTSSKWVADDPDLLAWVDYQVLATRDDGPNYGFNTTNVADCPSNPGTPGPGTKCVSRFTSGVAYAAGTATAPDRTKGMNAFCATCHKSYLTFSGSGTQPSTDATAYAYPGRQDANDGNGNVARYRHTVEQIDGSPPKQPLRFAAEGIDPNPPSSLTYDAMGCLTCHYAHGTSSAATPAPGSGIPAGPARNSALLFYDNLGVCISCHQTVGSPPRPTPTPTP